MFTTMRVVTRAEAGVGVHGVKVGVVALRVCVILGAAPLENKGTGERVAGVVKVVVEGVVGVA